MAASTSSFYALTSVASRIPMVSTVQKSVRAISRSRASSTTTAHEGDISRSGASTSASINRKSSQDLIMSTDTPESRLDRPSELRTAEWSFKGGVDWETARMGVGIWHDAIRRIDTLDAKRLRQMHIDALRYMYSALPSDLSGNEVLMLEDSPGAVSDSNRLTFANRAIDVTLLANESRSSNNFVRSSMALLVYWLISLVIFAIPITMNLLNRGLQYERDHQISKRAVQGGAEIAKAASSVGIDLGEKMLKFKNTEIGFYCGNTLAWTFQNMLEGINDGIQSSRSQYYLEAAKS